jgi:4-hydroxy-2-oxoheptanedioate aldolase
VRHALCPRGVHSGAGEAWLDMVMLTSDLSCMIADARMQLDELKSKTAYG